MPKTKHWDDTTRYALKRVVGGGHVVIVLAGGPGAVLLDGPDAEADAAIAELIDAGCPVLDSNEEALELIRQSRGRVRWDLAGSTDIGLWQDQWGTIWLRAKGSDQISGAAHLSKYEALGLAEKLIALANAASE
jgi:hypothetical protein